MQNIKIQFNRQTRAFSTINEAIIFLASQDLSKPISQGLPKPIKVTKKYSVWKSTEDFLKSEGL